MHNITLIGTHHSEIGECNSDELYKIIESIIPEVIFEELPSNYFDMIYSDSFDMYCINSILLNRHPPVVSPEVKCVKKYKQNHKIKNFPVDIDESPNLSENEKNLFTIFFNDDVYKKLEHKRDLLIEEEGFNYLNSDIFLDFLEEKEITEKKIMESEIHKDILLHTYKIFYKKQDYRENAWLEKIYNYSKENQYNQAVFLFGAAHRKSIMQKIKEYEKMSEIKLNWTNIKTNR